MSSCLLPRGCPYVLVRGCDGCGQYSDYQVVVVRGCGLVGCALFGSCRERLVSAMSSGERVGWLFLTVPLAVYIAARLVTHFFYNRYRYALVSPPWPLSKYAAALHFTSFQEIVANARSTALINPTPEFAEALERAGLHLKIRFAKPLYVVYLE